MSEHKFPSKITAWVRIDGVPEFQPHGSTLFPIGVEREYVDANSVRQAVILLRNPTNFSTLLDAFKASTEETVAGRLDGALRAIARASE